MGAKDDQGKPTGVKTGECITPHECEHTCATWLDAAGVRPVVVSRLTGSRCPRTTEARYTHVLAGDLELAREQFDLFLTEQLAKRISARISVTWGAVGPAILGF